ncbi:unnamed protein product [Caenorhabditis auriculariae]|uniref:Translation initiation factor eIF2B subunit gamma n=1 Tax=Caenorhabditis auriculariae TaxID=2777116 RepID=A0A8S1HG75_9PELO|nr:unnamed protein product [Caenorhabditis auriculariae]
MVSSALEIFDAKKTDRLLLTLEGVTGAETVLAIKKRIAQKIGKLNVERQSLRLEPKGKSVSDDSKLSDLNISSQKGVIYLKDLGPQIPWKTVFLVEYAGPFFIYPLFYLRPSFIYGSAAATKNVHTAVTYAFLCWSLHYAKRLFETQFIHRFSNGTMPRFNLFKNCSYYWGFAAFVAYFVNHPLFTPPSFGNAQIYLGLTGFLISEFGNLSIHILLRNLRPPGTRERRIPKPDGNPLSLLFNYVSCPNYTYEASAWLSFSLMVQSLPALLFTAAGFFQMMIWAKNKHRAYIKEFPDYPRSRLTVRKTEMSEIQGVVLCSGAGTRMTALTEEIPKCLLPVVGVPMFIYPVSSLLRAGLKDIKIFVRENVRDALWASLEEFGLEKTAQFEIISVTREQEEYGTADVLRNYASRITKDALVVSCDFVSDCSLIPMIDLFRVEKATLVALVSDTCVGGAAPGKAEKKSKKTKASDLMAISEERGRIAYLSAEEDFDSSIHTERWKFPRISLTSKYNDCHVYAIRHSALQVLQRSKTDKFSSLKADFIPYLIDQQFDENCEVSCFAYRLPHENGFVTAHANTISTYFEVNKAMLKSFTRLFPHKGTGRSFNYRETGVAMHESRVENDVEVGDKVVIKRTVALSGCKLGGNAKLKESLLLSDVKVGLGASITHSIVCEGAEIGENADINNCIVGPGQKVAPKAKISNEVLQDESNEEWAEA